MKRVLVVHAHPNRDSFGYALRNVIEESLAKNGVEHRTRDLYAESFDPRLPLAERAAHLEPPSAKPQLESYFDDLSWCDTIVFVHPTWWGSQPAILKGWIDRVWVRGVAWDLPDGASRLKPNLHNVRRLITVTTHGSSRLVNAVQGTPGKRVAHRSLRALCHPFCRVTWIAMYRLDTSSQDQRSAFLQRVRTRFDRLSR